MSKRFGSRMVFEELSRGFGTGAFTAVVGRSSTGKTTLLHLPAGLEPPAAGEVGLLGTSLGGLSRTDLAELRRRHVALITQEQGGLVPYLTATENVELGLRLTERDGDARAALVDVGLEERLHARTSSLSAGERERVATAGLSPPTSSSSWSTSRQPAWTRKTPGRRLHSSAARRTSEALRSSAQRTIPS